MQLKTSKECLQAPAHGIQAGPYLHLAWMLGSIACSFAHN